MRVWLIEQLPVFSLFIIDIFHEYWSFKVWKVSKDSLSRLFICPWLDTGVRSVSLAQVQTLPSCLVMESLFPFCPQETSSVSALIQACQFLLNKWLCASLCVCLTLCYIAGKLMLSWMISWWNIGTSVPFVFLIMHSLVDSRTLVMAPNERQTYFLPFCQFSFSRLQSSDQWYQNWYPLPVK